MGTSILKELGSGRFEVSGAVSSDRDPRLGKTLRSLGLCDSDVELQPPSTLGRVLDSCDVCVSFTRADAELANLTAYLESGRPVVMGTTGFTPEQSGEIEKGLGSRAPCVISSNFSVGANLLFALSRTLGKLPPQFDVSLLEIHHSGKADSPSGTAMTLAEIISKERGYSRTVHGRSGFSKRAVDELEVSSFRAGGMPGDHTVFAVGPHEMLRLEHLAFSRSAFSLGALLSAEWLSSGRTPGVYGMLDVLGLES